MLFNLTNQFFFQIVFVILKDEIDKLVVNDKGFKLPLIFGILCDYQGIINYYPSFSFSLLYKLVEHFNTEESQTRLLLV